MVKITFYRKLSRISTHASSNWKRPLTNYYKEALFLFVASPKVVNHWKLQKRQCAIFLVVNSAWCNVSLNHCCWNMRKKCAYTIAVK
jgi:hypothetical protein